MVPGHEAAGIVREVGPGVKDMKPGDHVVMVVVMSCGDCPDCVGGKPNLCGSSGAAKAAGTLISGERKISLNGKPINHATGISCFAEYAVVSRNSVVPIDRDVPLADAALSGEDLERAADYLARAVNLYPESFSNQRKLADLYEQLGRHDEAIAHLNRHAVRQFGLRKRHLPKPRTIFGESEMPAATGS